MTTTNSKQSHIMWQKIGAALYALLGKFFGAGLYKNTSTSGRLICGRNVHVFNLKYLNFIKDKTVHQEVLIFRKKMYKLFIWRHWPYLIWYE